MLHRFATFVVACTILLLLAGSLVTSTGSGLSVPDWPTSYGWNMFTFPPTMWVGGILYEHGHRLIASTVGFLTILLAAWLWRVDPRRWMKRLGAAALGTVILQGALGGITVLFFLPAAISTAHAGLAEIFFCMTVAMALFTSRGWLSGAEPVDDSMLRRTATATTLVIYAQIVVGAVMRHTDAGLAIPDFPLMFGHLIPDHWDSRIAVHFAHRAGALVVALSVLATAGHIWFHHPRRTQLTGPAALIVLLVAVQVTLGALTVLTRRDVWINSVHLVCGALVLATSIVITLRSWRVRFHDPVRLKPDTTTDTLDGLTLDVATPDVATRDVATRDVRSVRLQPDRESGSVRLQPDQGSRT
jgi:cytochrome c oxidase assembly protein subunit 15